MQKLLVSICALILFTSCTSQNNIRMNDTSTQYYTFQASHDKVWEASLNHLSSNYTIDNIDINTRTIYARFQTNIPNSVLDCGKIKDAGILSDGTPFTYIYNGADSPVYTISKIDDNYLYNTQKLDLEGSIQINLQSKSKNKTIVSIKTHYTLSKQNTYQPTNNKQKSFQNAYNENNNNETISFYSTEIGEFSTNTSANPMQCVANARITDSITKSIRQLLKGE